MGTDPTIDVATVRSPYAALAGSADVARGGWALSVATIDVSAPGEADGAGSLAVLAGAGLTLGWRGLRDGPASLAAPWVVLAPGLIAIVDALATAPGATQRLALWREDGVRVRSSAALRYDTPFPLTYGVLAGGAGTSAAEVVIARADADVRADRPVDVRGTPFAVRTRETVVQLVHRDTARAALLADADVLVDAFAPGHGAGSPGRPTGLALHNALLTVTPVNGVRLLAQLAEDDETSVHGTLWLDFGLLGILPTLPDPYAGRVRGLLPQRGRERFALLLLTARVGWTRDPAAVDDDDPSDLVTTGFAFGPLGAEAAALEAWTHAEAQAEAEAQAADDAPAAAPDPAPVARDVAGAPLGAFAFEQRVDLPGRVWDTLFARFGDEQFALLDVSSNADQMGVSFAFFTSPRDPTGGTGPFAMAYGGTAATPAPAFPLEIRALDLSAQSRFVRAFALPQVSWEPLFNLPTPAGVVAGDPPVGWNLYRDDGGATRLLTDAVDPVAIAPLPVAEFLVRDFATRAGGFTGALFTLPFGINAFAEFSRRNQFVPPGAPLPPEATPARLVPNRPVYEGGALVGGLQLRADAPANPPESPVFRGLTLQRSNVCDLGGTLLGAGTLGHQVGIIFNGEFAPDAGHPVRDRGVPVTRIDFSGYGASTFSHWRNPDAAVAATSQAVFDVWVGRTAQEVIQVRSPLYACGAHLVRTITITRASSGFVYRYDTGWVAETPGLYDFGYTAYKPGTFPRERVRVANPYEIHPGPVRGYFNIRNIRQLPSVPPFVTGWVVPVGGTYVDDNGELQKAGPPPALPVVRQALLEAVTYDADVQIDDVSQGGSGGLVPATGILGYVQLAPRGETIPKEVFATLLATQFGKIGGPLKCEVDVAGSGQRLRVSRVDMNASVDAVGTPIFAAAVRGAPVLPREGAWSVVQHAQGSGEVTPLDDAAGVPLVRRGRLLDPARQLTDASDATDHYRLADPLDLVRAPVAASRHYGFLQSTGTQKALFRQPAFARGVAELLAAAPDYADAYRMLNSPGIFPNVADAVPLALGAFRTRILPDGYQLRDPAAPAKAFSQPLPPGPLKLIDEEAIKLYVEYGGGGAPDPDQLQYGFDAAAADVSKKWLAKAKAISMVLDLGPLARVLTIRGRFDAEKGSAPAFREPELVFSPALDAVVKILQILSELQSGNYKAAMQDGLDVAMSNTAASWNYAFHARKEFPLVRFPPLDDAYNSPLTPLKLEATMAVGVYFNEALRPTADPKQLVPSAGGSVAFGGRVSVLCFSLAAAAIYATGTVDLAISADVKSGPSLDMRFGFGVELIVGLPVVGSVSVLYMAAVEIHLATSVTVAASLLFRGRAELLEGLITIQIQIEATGAVTRPGASGGTDLMAQVTFGVDVSLFLVINIHVSKSWQESRQIA
jgi:hypothetical protein